jgi:hypothetical protein
MINQAYVLPATPGVLYVTPVEFSHTWFNPLMAGVGDGSMVTLYGLVVVTQLDPVMVSATVNVPVPDAPQSTVTLSAPAPEVIVPPVTVHK